MPHEYKQSSIFPPPRQAPRNRYAPDPSDPPPSLSKGTYPRVLSTAIIYENMTILKMGLHSRPLKRRGGGIRKAITVWSARSRLRLMKTLARVTWTSLPPPVWVTLTYHCPAGDWPPHAYVDLHQWLTAVQRLYGEVNYIWRYERQQRGAPHFHVILWPPSRSQRFQGAAYRIQLAHLWHTLADPHSRAHALYGAHIEPLKSYRQASRYVAKYVSKESRENPADAGKRRWGRSHRLPLTPSIDYECSPEVVLRLRRLLRRFVHATARDRARAVRYVMGHATIEIFVGAVTAQRMLFHVMDFDPSNKGP